MGIQGIIQVACDFWWEYLQFWRKMKFCQFCQFWQFDKPIIPVLPRNSPIFWAILVAGTDPESPATWSKWRPSMPCFIHPLLFKSGGLKIWDNLESSGIPKNPWMTKKWFHLLSITLTFSPYLHYWQLRKQLRSLAVHLTAASETLVSPVSAWDRILTRKDQVQWNDLPDSRDLNVHMCAFFFQYMYIYIYI